MGRASILATIIKDTAAERGNPLKSLFAVAKINALSIICLFVECLGNTPNGSLTSPYLLAAKPIDP